MRIKQRVRGGVYYAHFTGPNGERIRRSTETTDETLATIKAAEMIRETLTDTAEALAAHPQFTTAASVSALLRNAWTARWSWLSSARGIRLRMGRLAREIGHWPVSLVTTDRIRTHFDSMRRGSGNSPLSAASKNRYASLLCTALRLEQERSPALVIPRMPHWAENNVRERYVSDDEERRILHYFEERASAANAELAYLRDTFIVLIDTGMRCSEALEEMSAHNILEWPDGTTAVHLHHGCTKSGKGRTIPLTSRAAAAVVRMLASPLHGRWTSQNAGRRWRTVMAHLDISGVNLHILRHTTASRLIQREVDIYTVSVWLGHSSIEMTKRYAHLAPRTLRTARDALEGVTRLDVPSPTDVSTALEAHPPAIGTKPRGNLRLVK